MATRKRTSLDFRLETRNGKLHLNASAALFLYTSLTVDRLICIHCILCTVDICKSATRGQSRCQWDGPTPTALCQLSMQHRLQPRSRHSNQRVSSLDLIVAFWRVLALRCLQLRLARCLLLPLRCRAVGTRAAGWRHVQTREHVGAVLPGCCFHTFLCGACIGAGAVAAAGLLWLISAGGRQVWQQCFCGCRFIPLAALKFGCNVRICRARVCSRLGQIRLWRLCIDRLVSSSLWGLALLLLWSSVRIFSR